MRQFVPSIIDKIYIWDNGQGYWYTITTQKIEKSIYRESELDDYVKNLNWKELSKEDFFGLQHFKDIKESKVSEGQHLCNCERYALFAYGCKCGGI